MSHESDQHLAMSVGELTDHIKAVLEGTFPSMWVSGELSGIAQPRSGHVYFTLKDDDAQIRGVMWRGVASKLDFELEEGQEVLCFGNVEVYAPRGTYQIVVRKIQPQGIGALQLALQRLQQKLAAEGLFLPERKKEIPRFPRRIGIVTSPSGAAVRDFLQAAANRFQGIEVVGDSRRRARPGCGKVDCRGTEGCAPIHPQARSRDSVTRRRKLRRSLVF